MQPSIHLWCHFLWLSIALFSNQGGKEECVTTHFLTLNLLKTKGCWNLGRWGFGRIKDHVERTEEKWQEEMKISFLLHSAFFLWSSVDATSSLQDGAPSHHHTVHLGSAAPCIHCSRNKRPPLVRQGRSKEGKGRPRPGETTVFSVGRWGYSGPRKGRLSWCSQ